MNQKDRAINLGLKINSLKGNFSVAKSTIRGLEKEITNAVIDLKDKNSLLELYKRVVHDINNQVSPSAEERNRLNQLIEDTLNQLKESNEYLTANKIEGKITFIEEQIEGNSLLKKEDKDSLMTKCSRLKESQKIKVGRFLKNNHEKLYTEISSKCKNDNPFHVSVTIKKYNEILKITPLFTDDRYHVRSLLDSLWQKSVSDIKQIKEENGEYDV